MDCPVRRSVRCSGKELTSVVYGASLRSRCGRRYRCPASAAECEHLSPRSRLSEKCSINGRPARLIITASHHCPGVSLTYGSRAVCSDSHLSTRDRDWCTVYARVPTTCRNRHRCFTYTTGS